MSQTRLKNCKLNAMAEELTKIFSDICPVYLRQKCKDAYIRDYDTKDLVSLLFETDYPKRQILPHKPQALPRKPQVLLSLEEQLEFIKQILPEADPDYLYRKCDELIDNEQELKMFINQAIANPNYPTKAEYLRRQKVSAQQRQYTTQFNVEEYLKLIPDPVEYFENTENMKKAKTNSKTENNFHENNHYKLCLLRNIFRDISKYYIKQKLSRHKSLTKTFKVLQSSDVKRLKTLQKKINMPSPVQNIPLLQEAAYVKHYQEIIDYLEQQEVVNKLNRLHAKTNGLMQTCECCYDDEIMPSDIVECESTCKFCKRCVEQYVEITFASGKVEFFCLKDCSSNFNLMVLQQVLSPKLFSKIAYQIQISEVKAANIENIEMCPFCEFAAIPPAEDKIFRCLNSDCMKETCRLCKQPSHIPLRCEEVEKDENIKVRTYIENKMTEAFVRTCWKCQIKFIKTEGCNKMTCSCGAIMCYLCRKPVRNYTHFAGEGATIFQKLFRCPLYSDSNELHKLNIIHGALAAKRDVASNIRRGQLMNDRTADIDKLSTMQNLFLTIDKLPWKFFGILYIFLSFCSVFYFFGTF